MYINAALDLLLDPRRLSRASALLLVVGQVGGRMGHRQREEVGLLAGRGPGRPAGGVHRRVLLVRLDRRACCSTSPWWRSCCTRRAGPTAAPGFDKPAWSWPSLLAMTTTIDGIGGLNQLVGEHLGYSEWHQVTQEQVNLFADATGDHQWIHVDIERAKAGPFGGPIAHGYLTLSLVPALLAEIFDVVGISMAINYGLNKLRFPAPVPVGSQLRAGATLAQLEDVAGGVQVTLDGDVRGRGRRPSRCASPKSCSATTRECRSTARRAPDDRVDATSRDSLPEGEAKVRAVRAMFDTIAPRYDLVNRVMTFGLDRRWRHDHRALARACRPVARVLDVACGTGDLCRDLSRGRLRGRSAWTSRPGCWPTPAPPPRWSTPTPCDSRSVAASLDGAVSGFALRNFVALWTVLRRAGPGPAPRRPHRLARRGHSRPSAAAGRPRRVLRPRRPPHRRPAVGSATPTATSRSRWPTCPPPDELVGEVAAAGFERGRAAAALGRDHPADHRHPEFDRDRDRRSTRSTAPATPPPALVARTVALADPARPARGGRRRRAAVEGRARRPGRPGMALRLELPGGLADADGGRRGRRGPAPPSRSRTRSACPAAGRSPSGRCRSTRRAPGALVVPRWIVGRRGDQAG